MFLLLGLALAQQSHTVFLKHGSVLILPDTVITAKKDTVVNIPDNISYEIKDLSDIKSQSFYDSLGVKTRNNRVTNLIFKSLVLSSSSAKQESVDFEQSESVYLPYEGKVIGRIRIKKVQVLAGSVFDTLEIAESSVSNFLNNLHYPTRDGVIRNNLLFEVGEVVDPFVLADNERILRELPYIEDARIEVVISEDDENLVDIIVITKDLFSLGISPSVLDLNRARVAFFDRNLLGLGTELRYTLHYDKREKPKYGHEGKYVMTNIKGTFIF
jgi:outer membrane protein assembly factor BamA